jgi:hypothetical protein
LSVFDKIKKVVNVFTEKDKNPLQNYYAKPGNISIIPEHTNRLPVSSDKSIIGSIYNRISIDVANYPIKHVLFDETDRYVDDIDGSVNERLTISPNIDQTPRSFRQDIALTLLQTGSAAVVPVDYSTNKFGRVIKINSLRVGTIKEWRAKHLKVDLYNEEKGKREEVVLSKAFVAVIENPLYMVMNSPNSTLQRLTRKLSILDRTDEAAASNKLDLIIQLPYVIKNEARKQQAVQRREDIEFQLKSSDRGIAYVDGTEKIVQLNRPIEGNVLPQIEFLTKMLFDQLGVTSDVIYGAADERVMLNYLNRTIVPILESITQSLQNSALLGDKVYKGERIRYFIDPFKLVPLSEIAKVADSFSRNEIFSPNDIRGFIGLQPSNDPMADEMRNRNMPDRQLEEGDSW